MHLEHPSIICNQISFGSERPDSVAARTVDWLAIRDRAHEFLQLNNPIFIIGGQSTSQLKRTEPISFILCPHEEWYIFIVFSTLAAVARKDFNTQTLSPLLAANRIIGAHGPILHSWILSLESTRGEDPGVQCTKHVRVYVSAHDRAGLIWTLPYYVYIQ